MSIKSKFLKLAARFARSMLFRAWQDPGFQSAAQGMFDHLIQHSPVGVSIRTLQRSRQAFAVATAPSRHTPIHCVLLAQMPELWPSWKTFWLALMRDPQFRVTVVSLPFLSDSYGESRLTDFLLQNGIPYVPEEEFDWSNASADIVFVQNPYDHTRPRRFQTPAILDSSPRLAYIPYALEIGGGEENYRYQFDTDVHRRAWRVFVRSERHKTMYGLHCSAGNGHAVVTGHPRADLAAESAVSAKEFEKLGDRVTLLWNPHFSFSPGQQYSTFLQWKDLFPRLARERQSMGLIVRPHPLLRKTLVNKGVMTEDEVNAYFADLGALPNVALDESNDYLAAFSRSHALISDISSFLLEYLLTKKPVLYLRSPESPGLNEDGDVIDNYATAEDDAGIVAFVDHVLRGDDALQARRTAAVSEYFFLPDGNAGRRIKDYVLGAIRMERGKRNSGVRG